MNKNKKIRKRVLSFALAVMLVAGSLPGAALRALAEEVNKPFSVGEEIYSDLNEALTAAQADETKLVTVSEDTTLPEGTYTIPAGVTLLVPCMDDDPGYIIETKYDKETKFGPDGTDTTGQFGPNAQTYRTLNVPNNVTLNIEGTLLVNAVTGRKSAGLYDQDVNGGCGEIMLGGKIQVKSGGLLDVYGYVKGTGSIEAESGGTVQDLYVVRHWRGGTVASGTFSTLSSITESDMHNIQVRTAVMSGATLSGNVKMFADKQYHRTLFAQIDNEDGMIHLAEGANAVKTYAGEREQLELSGGGTTGSGTLNIAVLGLSLNTMRYLFPVDGDNDFVLNGGEWKIEQAFKFMPGATLTLKQGAALTIAKDVSPADGKKVSVRGLEGCDTNAVVFYDSNYQDPFNNSGFGGTKYPTGRGNARLIMQGGTRLDAEGAFGGRIEIEKSATRTNPATIQINGAAQVTALEAETANFLKCTTKSFNFGANIEGYPLESGKTYTCYYVNDELCIEVSSGGGQPADIVNGTVDSSQTYDNTEKTYRGKLTWTGNTEVEDVEYQYLKHDGDGSITNSVTDAGTYDVLVTKIDNESGARIIYGTIEGGLVIAPAPLTVTWGDEKYTYDGNEKTVTAELSGQKDGDTVTLELTGNKETNVGEYEATAELTGDDCTNYAVNEESLKHYWTIDKAPLTLEWSGTGQIYDGNEKSVKAKLDGVVEKDREDVIVSLSGDKETDAGTYTATATIKGNTGNYTDPEDLTYLWKIEQAEAPEIEFPTVENSVTYDPEQTLKNIQLSFDENEYGTFEWTDPDTVPTVPVTGYNVTFTPSKEAENNYGLTEQTAEVFLTVEKAERTAPKAGEDFTVTQPTAVGQTGHITGLSAAMEWSNTNTEDGQWTTVTPEQETSGMDVAQGSTLFFRYAETENYHLGEVSEPITIDLYVPVTFDANGGTWDDSSEELTVARKPGEQMTEPEEPTRPDAHFDGWYKDQACTEAWDFESIVPNENLTLYAKWLECEWELVKTTDPTCDEEGTQVEKCKIGGETRTEELPAKGHTLSHVEAVDSTTTATGRKEHWKCEICGKLFADDTGMTEVTEAELTIPVKQRPSSSSPGASAPGAQTGPDEVSGTGGSTTETTTNPDGSKTESTTYADGTVTEKTTEKDSTVTEKTAKPDGTTTEKVTQPDGAVTEKTTTPEGISGQVEKNAEGNVTSANVNIPNDLEKQEIVTAPVTIPAEKDAAKAPEVHVQVGFGETAKVELPVTEFGPGTVAILVHEDGTEEVVRDCTIGENGVILNVEGDVTLKIVERSQNFTDVASGNWASDAVEFVAARELFQGTGNQQFTPEGNMTRGMLVTVLYRLAYEPEAAQVDFGDIDQQAYYSDAVAWAASNGVVTGYSDHAFGPDDDITREQLATILYRYAKNHTATTGQTAALSTFADASQISPYAAEAMSWAVSSGLINGVGNNQLAPEGEATRAQVATMLMRFCEKIA